MSTSKGQAQQSSSTQPWQPTQPLLNNIIGGLNTNYNNVAPTGAETNALNQIQQNAGLIPGYGAQATNLTNQLFSGGTDRTGIVNNAYSQLQNTLSPYTQANYLDPTTSPGMQGVLDTIRNDVSNQVNGLFAGAGRDLSGAHTQTLARGIAQGEAQPLLNQYNQNVAAQQGAANSLFGAGGQTAGLLSGLDQTSLQNMLQGLQTAPQIGQAANAGANAQLDAAQTARNLPLSNIGNIENLLLPIAGLGSQSQGVSNYSQTASPLSSALGIFKTLFPGGL